MATRAKAVPMMEPPKPRAAQHITMSLGLATFSVGIAPLKSSRKKEGAANFICEDHKVKVEQRWWCPEGKHYIERKDDAGALTHAPIKGYAFGDTYVILDKDTEANIQIPREDSIELTAWDDHLDPIWVEKTQMVWPTNSAAARTYDAIAAAMIKHRFVLFGESNLGKTTHIQALAWSTDLSMLVLHQLHLRSDLKLADAANVATGIANRERPKAAVVTEVKRAMDAVLEQGWEPEVPNYARQALVAAIEEIATGGTLKPREKPAKKDEDVPDLLASLRESVAAAQKAKAKKVSAKKAASKGGKK